MCPVSGDLVLSQGLDQLCIGSWLELLHCTITMCHVHSARELSADKEDLPRSCESAGKHDLGQISLSADNSLAGCTWHMVMVQHKSLGQDLVPG